jgi:hypothetical protein
VKTFEKWEILIYREGNNFPKVEVLLCDKFPFVGD